MINLINKIFSRTSKFDYINSGFKKIIQETEISKIFKAIESYSLNSEIRYVGGCVRKIINKEEVDDIDLAVNLKPNEVCDAFKKNNIKFYESGIIHGTITTGITVVCSNCTGPGARVEAYPQSSAKRKITRLRTNDLYAPNIHSKDDGPSLYAQKPLKSRKIPTRPIYVVVAGYDRAKRPERKRAGVRRGGRSMGFLPQGCVPSAIRVLYAEKAYARCLRSEFLCWEAR